MSSKLGSRRLVSRGSELIEDYVSRHNFLEGLKELNFINEEYITKLKIIAMGRILENGILEKVPGNSNKIVKAFCENVEQFHLKRSELSLHVFYFLHQLFAYMKQTDEFIEAEEGKNKQNKLKVFQKSNLDLKDFFTKILCDIVNYTRSFYKETNIQYRLKESKILEDCLTPFKEKSNLFSSCVLAALVLLSVMNSTSKEKFIEFIFNDPKKLVSLMISIKKLTKKINFKEPYHLYFEKKKIQVMRKVNDFVISIFMDKDPETLGTDYHPIVNQCRINLIFMWTLLTKIKQEY